LNVDVAPFLLSVRGDKPDVAVAGAKTVIAVETGLAKAAMDRTERRDPKKRDHTMQATEIAAVAPGFQLTQYFAEIGAPKFASLNVGNPGFFKTVNEQLRAIPGDEWPYHPRPSIIKGLPSDGGFELAGPQSPIQQ
jgi:putative endopeptidase